MAVGDDLLAQIATDLDRHMCARSLTQKALYKAAGVGEGTVSRILRARDCRVSTLVQIGRALGVEVTVIFHAKNRNI